MATPTHQKFLDNLDASDAAVWDVAKYEKVTPH